jgi:hypothetical protein
MKDQKDSGLQPPQSLDEFISRYAPLFAAHPNEFAMVIERDDNDGWCGGPCSHSPWGDRSRGMGIVMNTNYYLAVIDPAKSFEKNELVTLKFPVGPTMLVHLHGTHILEGREMGAGLFDLLKMEEALIDLDPICGNVQLPQWELFVGDAEVARALDRVRNEQELVAIGIAARKLGRPITGSAAVDRTREAKIGSLVSRLIKNVFHWTDLDRDSDKQRCLDELAALGIDKEVAVQRCLERLLVELKSAFGIKA